MRPKKGLYLFIAILLVSLLMTTWINGQERQKTVQIKQIEAAPKIDGLLTDDCWQGSEPLTGFIQYDPVNGAKASEETLAWLAYDIKYIYFAFYMKDSQPAKIWAELTPRNNYWYNDSITVILDTYNDKRTSISFMVNARGVQSNSTETIWKSAATIVKDGWIAEIAIPFKSLRFSSRNLQLWGINFERYIPRLKETDYWTMVKRDIPLLQQMGELSGLSGIKPSYNIEFFPYFGFRSSHRENEKDEKDEKVAAGLDFKYGILPNLILDMTASPDFSEVESDPFIYQLSPYENYLFENRPFFTEGSQYFGGESEDFHGGFRPASFNLFYSRRIGNPKIAAKLTGKTSGYSFGLLGALNKEEGDDSAFSVVRIQKDIFHNSQIGIYYAGIDQGDEYNRSIALDYNFNFSDFYYIRGQSAFALNSNTDNKNNGMHAIQFQLQPDTGLTGQMYYKRVEKDVQVKTGYIDKTDTQFIDVDLGYAWRFNKGQLKHLNINISPNFEYNCDGGKTLESWSIMNGLEFLSQLGLNWWIEKGKSRYQVFNPQEELEWTDRYINTFISSLSMYWEQGGFLKSLRFEGEYEHTGIYNDTFTAVEPGKEFKVELGLTLRPRSNLQFSVEGEWIRQSLDSTGEKVFDGLTYETGLHYQITKDLFLSSFLRGETRDEQYNVDILAGYYFGAGNIIQLSYKRFASHVESLREKGYSITLKVSYLLRI